MKKIEAIIRKSKFDDVKKQHKKFKDLNKSFIFLNPGFNFRNKIKYFKRNSK